MAHIIGYIAGFLAMVSFVPQIIKTFRTKKADDISLAMLVVTLITNLLYVIYGLLLDLYPVIIMLGIMSCIIVVQILLTLKYRTKSDGKPNHLIECSTAAIFLIVFVFDLQIDFLA